MHVLTFLAGPLQQLIHHLLVHHFLQVSLCDLPVSLETKQKWPWPVFLNFLVWQYEMG